MNLIHFMRHQLKPRPAVPANTAGVRIVRRFVETGDERCPIAGIWSRLDADNAAPDEAELPRPALRRLLSWRASSPAVRAACPA